MLHLSNFKPAEGIMITPVANDLGKLCDYFYLAKGSFVNRLMYSIVL